MENLEINTNQSKILTGSHDLNNWLEGGYETGVITLLYGPPASGKSNFAIMTSCHQAKKDKKIVFIDTEGSFSIDRVKQISGGVPEFILKNIVILKPVNFNEQKTCFYKLSRDFKSKNIGLIIVDSITMLYRLDLAEARKKGIEQIKRINSDLANQM
ncbi:MAG: ATPase domain-containing protein [Candidatus Nanoarchaeia archaeon]|nr:ATPase domain-containing protein [Candidatus Nanoarchaeia archaeon]